MAEKKKAKKTKKSQKKAIAKTRSAKESKDPDNTHIVAVLAYFLAGIIWYFADDKVKGKPLAKHHTKQALMLFIVWVGLGILSIFMAIVTAVIMIVPLLGAVIGGLISIALTLMNLLLFVLWIIGLVYAINKNTKDIPLIGKFAKKIFTF